MVFGGGVRDWPDGRGIWSDIKHNSFGLDYVLELRYLPLEHIPCKLIGRTK